MASAVEKDDFDDLFSGAVALSNDPIVTEARSNFDRGMEWEGTSRNRFMEDLRFRNGDSDNGYQWPNTLKQGRDNDNKPSLTMNIIRQHNLIIANEMRKNKSSIKFIATGGQSTQESASVLRDIERRIEYQSRAQSAFTMARNFMVDAGIGWWRLKTDHPNNDTFDQEIYIQIVPDPMSIIIDPDCKEHDKSDAEWGLVFDMVPRKSFRRAHPKYVDLMRDAPLGIGILPERGKPKDNVWVCEYFRKERTKDTLVSFVYMGERKTLRKSMMPKGVFAAIVDDPLTKTRPTETVKVMWYLIVGNTVIDKTEWAGKYIPLIPCIGEETVIDGIMDRKGHTRAMKDAQRMFNYNASAQVEFGALQTKVPWLAALKSIEELEQYWNTANTTNHSVLPYNAFDDEGNPIPAPTRPDPPQASPAFQTGMDTAFQQLMMTSGQWQNSMGMGGNERTGAAIGKREQQGETSTYHFADNFEEALVNTGRQILDLIPKIYDTKRIIKIIAEDGTDYELTIDPTARDAYLEEQDRNNQAVKKIFNPSLGEYDVASSVGPEYGSKREETVEALTLILTQNPGLTGIIGDLLLSTMEFDKAQEAAQRLKRMVPPQALGNGPSQQEQILTQQVQSLTELLGKSMEEQAKMKIKLVGKDQKRDIDVFEAETNRMKALQDFLPLDPEGLKQMVQQIVGESSNTTLDPIISANADSIDPQGQGEEPGEQFHPALGASKAPDGEWYMTDPTRRGKYLRLAPLAQMHKPGGVR